MRNGGCFYEGGSFVILTGFILVPGRRRLGAAILEDEHVEVEGRVVADEQLGNRRAPAVKRSLASVVRRKLPASQSVSTLSAKVQFRKSGSSVSSSSPSPATRTL